ncbi:MAG: hypothetical protein ACXVMS_16740 [Flavisolibacter sp.]
MAFVEFLEKYYLPDKQRELSFLLNRLSIYEDVQACLETFYQSAESKNKIEIVSQLVSTVRGFLVLIYKSFQCLPAGLLQITAEQIIGEFLFYLMKETWQISGLYLSEYFGLLFQTTRKTFDNNGWNVFIFEKWLGFDVIKPFATEEKQRYLNCPIAFSKPVKLDWLGEKQLDFFVDDLAKTFQGVKTKKQLFHLFDSQESDFKIELPSRYLLSFLCLFYELHGSGSIRVTGNRGLFIYLQGHLQAPLDDHYPKRNFRKLRYDAEHNLKLQKQISKQIKPLLDKYCHSGR